MLHYKNRADQDSLTANKTHIGDKISNPYRYVTSLFLGVMLLGSFLLSLPIATRSGESTPYIDALFTAVSAVAITGLTTVDTHLHWSIFGQTVIIILCQLGGLGFTVIFDVTKNYKRGFSYFSLHSKVMLVGSLSLVLISIIMISILEWNNPATLGALNWSGKLQSTIFQAITPRSGGLATVDYGTMFNNTQLFTIWLMFIGAGPGSTGGGVKVTTIVVLLLAGLAIFKGRKEVRLFERRVPYYRVSRTYNYAIFYDSCANGNIFPRLF